MNAILQFNLPEDNVDFKMATHGVKAHLALWDYDQFLRSKIKYASDDVSEEVIEHLQECRDNLYEYMNKHGISFDYMQ